jgi:hypothetical protein
VAITRGCLPIAVPDFPARAKSPALKGNPGHGKGSREGWSGVGLKKSGQHPTAGATSAAAKAFSASSTSLRRISKGDAKHHHHTICRKEEEGGGASYVGLMA